MKAFVIDKFFKAKGRCGLTLGFDCGDCQPGARSILRLFLRSFFTLGQHHSAADGPPASASRKQRFPARCVPNAVLEQEAAALATCLWAAKGGQFKLPKQRLEIKPFSGRRGSRTCKKCRSGAGRYPAGAGFGAK